MRYKPVEKFFIKLKGSSASVPGGGGGGGGGAGRQSASPPQKKKKDFRPGNFYWPIGKIYARKQREIGWKRRKIEKVEVKYLKWKEKLQNEEKVLFFFFFFFFFTFQKWMKFVFGLPKWKFSTGKKHFTPGKKSGKMILPLRKIFPVNAPVEGTNKNGIKK